MENRQTTDGKYIVLYDGVCNFCNAVVNFVAKHDTKGVFSFLPIQTREARLLLRKCNEIFINLNTVYLIEENVSYRRSEAIFRIFRQLPYPWKLFSAFRIFPRFIMDFFYRIVAKYRYRWFGKIEASIPETNIIP